MTGTMVSIEVTPDFDYAPKGASRQYTAYGIYSDQTRLDITSIVQWQTGDNSIATPDININGLINMMSAGKTTIFASYNSITSNNANVSVISLNYIKLIPSNVSMPIGGTVEYSALGYYDEAGQQDITLLSSWNSDNVFIASIAFIEGKEIATANNVGTAIITASYDGVTSYPSSFAVTEKAVSYYSIYPSNQSLLIGSLQQFNLRRYYTNGTYDTVIASSWTSSNTSVLTINSSGLATGKYQGNSIITATYIDNQNKTHEAQTSVDVSAVSSQELNNLIINGGQSVYNNYIIPGKIYDISTRTSGSPLYICGSNMTAGRRIGNVVLYNEARGGSLLGKSSFSLLQSIPISSSTSRKSLYSYKIYFNDVGVNPANTAMKRYEYYIGDIASLSGETITLAFTAKADTTNAATFTVSYRLNSGNGGLNLITDLPGEQVVTTTEFYFYKQFILPDISTIYTGSLGENNSLTIIINCVNSETTVTSGVTITEPQISVGEKLPPIKCKNKSTDEMIKYSKTACLPELLNTDQLYAKNNYIWEGEGDVLTLRRSKEHFGMSYLEFSPPVPVGSGRIWYFNTPPIGYLMGNGMEFSATKYKRLKKRFTEQNESAPGIPMWGYGNSCTAISDPLEADNMVTINWTNTAVSKNTPIIHNLPTGSGHFNVDYHSTTKTVISCGPASDIINATDPYISLWPGDQTAPEIYNPEWFLVFIIDGIIKHPTYYVSPNEEHIAYVMITTGMSSNSVALAIIEALNPLCIKNADPRGYFLRFTALGSAVDPDYATRIARPDGVYGDQPGTTQLCAIESHSHDLTSLGLYATASSPPAGPIHYLVGNGSLSTPPITSDLVASSSISDTGGIETRAVNMTANLIIKY